MTSTNTTQLRTTTFLLALLCACTLSISTAHAGAGGGGDIGDPPPGGGGVTGGGGSGGGEDDPIDGDGETTTEETGGGGGEDDDTTPPVSTLLLNGEVNVSIYYTDVELTLTADDNSSGVEKIEYTLNGGEWQEYGGPILITTEGPHAVRWRSNDLAGNQEVLQEASFEIFTLKGILEHVFDELESGTSRAAHKARKMLDILLSERYWETRNTLNSAGARSVLSHLENALRFLQDPSHETIREKIEIVLQKLLQQ